MTMTLHEQNLYALAERLHMGVWQLMPMPVSEYFGWIEYVARQNQEAEKEEQIKKGNLLAMDTSQIVQRVTGGN